MQPSADTSEAMSASIFSQAIRGSQTKAEMSSTGEVESYFSGAYPCTDEDVLGWYKVRTAWMCFRFAISCYRQTHIAHFPIISHMARDILCIPGVSISVERLFSSSKRTMNDARSSMTATTASKTIVTKERLKKGLGHGIDYLQGINIRS
jgi:hypothetical protein